MADKQENDKPASSLLPMLIMGGLILVGVQYFGGGLGGPSSSHSPSGTPAPLAEDSQATIAGANDFKFVSEVPKSAKLDTGFYTVELNSTGGRIASLLVKNHETLIIPPQVLGSAPGLEVTRGNGMDFQPHLYFRDDATGSLGLMSSPYLNQAVYKMEGPFQNQEGTQEIRFRLPVTFGKTRLEIVKVFRFFKNESFFRQITVIRNLEKSEFKLGGDLFFRTAGDIGPTPDMQDSRSISNYNRFYYANDELTMHPSLVESSGGLSCTGGCKRGSKEPYTVVTSAPHSVAFAGSMSRYFFTYAKFLAPDSALMHRPDSLININGIDPSGRHSMSMIFRDFKLGAAQGPEVDTGDLEKKGSDNFTRVTNSQKTRTDALIVDSQVFVGVRSDEEHAFRNTNLAKYEFGSSDTEDRARKAMYSQSFLAMFSKIRDGIVWVMRLLFGYIGNYGWTIIIIAVVFKLLTYPLNQMQAKSMKRMAALRPELDKLNAKYADNPQEKQKRTMELYKEHNINPAKGCFPILIQMPVFIALYSAFSESIELWRSPFVLWMKDLSGPDTIFIIPNLLVTQNFHINILPLIMVVSQLLQQRLTTVVADPQQKMMMYLMPFMMLFFFWNMPSGVTLYWTVQNFLAILWQLAANKYASADDPKS